MSILNSNFLGFFRLSVGFLKVYTETIRFCQGVYRYPYLGLTVGDKCAKDNFGEKFY